RTGRGKNGIALPAALPLALCAGEAEAESPNDILHYKGPDRQQRLIEGARKEGQVVLYSSMIVHQGVRPMADKFAKKYPFVKITYWRADSEDITQKLSAEVRANNVVADVFEGTGLGEMAVEANVTQSYYTPAIEAYPAALHDPTGMWTPTRLSYCSIAYNTRTVAEDKVPRSYEALLDPQWKGKMAWRIGSSTGTPLFITNLRLAWGEEKARAYFEKLRDQKIVNFGAGSARTLVDRVIARRDTISLKIFAHHPPISRPKGAPVHPPLLQ